MCMAEQRPSSCKNSVSSIIVIIYSRLSFYVFFAIFESYEDADIRKIKDLSQHGAAYCKVPNQPEALTQFTTNHQIFCHIFPNNVTQVPTATVVGNVPVVSQQSVFRPLTPITPQTAPQTVAQSPPIGPITTHSFEGDALSSYYNPPHPKEALPAYTASPTPQQTANARPHYQTNIGTTGALNSRELTRPTEKGSGITVSSPQLQPSAINGYNAARVS